MFQEERETVNLLAQQQQQHQPSYDYDYDDDDDAEGEEDKDDILSLRDLPLTTTSRNWTAAFDTDPKGDHHRHQEDGFEFFSGEFNQEEEEGDIIFCGKIIPYRASNAESSSNFHRRRSSSLNNKPRDYSSTHHHNHQVKRFWSLPVSASNGLGDSLRSGSDQRCDSPMKRVSKSRWYVLAFGVEKIPVKMELHDMKFRQSKNFNTQMFQPNQQVVKQNGSSRKGSLWGLLGILGCNREEASNMVKASFVCIPNV